MRRLRSNPTHNWHTFALILLSILIIITVFYPLHFVGDYYQWTGLLLMGIGLAVHAYARWVFVHRRIRFLAVVLIVITVATTTFNIIEFAGVEVHECSMESPISMRCSMKYIVDESSYVPGHVWYLTMEHFPLGIQTEYEKSFLLILF